MKFKVLDGTEPILSMPMLVANGNKVVFIGEDAISITADGETAPLTSIEDDWYLKVLVDNSGEFIRIDVWTPCHVFPPSWVRNLSPEMKKNVNSMLCEKRQRPACGTLRSSPSRRTIRAQNKLVPRAKPATRRCWKTLRYQTENKFAIAAVGALGSKHQGRRTMGDLCDA